ncbi:MAG: rod shape-determining protein MreC [Minisyncoccus archaeiphilus]|uniref:rod shape-determining protein MreC n=1 Tax=Minisyncoccus archaeiphilus TaxID=3238481 RepID=UPI002B09C8AA|nr:MAG: rod shape-determining protein MreC [Candidatus Parcubacteria bacterium]
MDQKFKNRMISLILVSLLLVGLNYFASDVIKDTFYGQTEVSQDMIWRLASAITFSSIDQVNETRKLTEDNQKLLADLASYKEIKEENDFLRKVLEMKDLKGHSFIDANAIGGARFNGSSFEYDDSILINRGKNDGVQKGFSVVTADKILIGRVSEAYDNHSRVMLFTDKSSLVDVQIAREKKITVKEKVPETSIAGEEGEQPEELTEVTREEIVKDVFVLDKNIAIVKGEGGLRASLDMFPKDSELEDGALVVTSSLTGTFPSGFVVGRVKDPKKVDTESFKEAEVVPAFDRRLLNKVLVIKDIEIIKND